MARKYVYRKVKGRVYERVGKRAIFGKGSKSKFFMTMTGKPGSERVHFHTLSKSKAKRLLR